MKKILLLSNMYPSAAYPHYGIFVKNCEQVLQENGHQVDRVVIEKQTGAFQKLLAYLQFYTRALWKGLTGGYDCVYAHYASHMMPVVTILRRLRPKLLIVTNVHGNDIVPVSPAEQKNPARSQKTLDRSDLVIAPSQYFETVLQTQYRIHKDKIVVFPSGGVDQRIFRPESQERARQRERTLFEKKDLLVGCISRLEPTKGWDTFLDAIPKLAASHPDWQFVLIGDGSSQLSCKEKLLALPCKNQIKMLGMLSQEQLAEQTNRMDILCVPSQQESLGLVGLEGMSCGVPCVISAIPGMLSYAKNEENCLTFAPGNCDALAQAVEKMYRRPDDICARMFASQMQMAGTYEMEALGCRLAQLFAQLPESSVLGQNDGKRA